VLLHHHDNTARLAQGRPDVLKHNRTSHILRFHTLPLDQGQAPIATRMMKKGVKEECWRQYNNLKSCVFVGDLILCISLAGQSTNVRSQRNVD